MHVIIVSVFLLVHFWYNYYYLTWSHSTVHNWIGFGIAIGIIGTNRLVDNISTEERVWINLYFLIVLNIIGWVVYGYVYVICLIIDGIIWLGHLLKSLVAG
jgi:hypothetical protein